MPFCGTSAAQSCTYFLRRRTVVCISAVAKLRSHGQHTNSTCAAFDIKDPVLYAELDITDFLSAQLPPVTYRQLPKYPALERDFCFVLRETVRSSEISQEILSLSPLVEDVTPFDVYRGEKLGPGLGASPSRCGCVRPNARWSKRKGKTCAGISYQPWRKNSTPRSENSGHSDFVRKLFNFCCGNDIISVQILYSVRQSQNTKRKGAELVVGFSFTVGK